MNAVFIMWIQYSSGTQLCEDDPNYIGPFDEVCEQWDRIDCTSAHWRLGPVQQRLLLARCPKTCRRCGKGKMILKPINLHPLQCHDDLRWKKMCRKWKGKLCGLELSYKKRKNLVRYCRETCKVCKKDYSQQTPAQDCLFPFKFEDKWYRTCMDTVGLSPYSLQNDFQTQAEEHAWCPLYLEKDSSYEGSGVFRPCFSPREKRFTYDRCLVDEDCVSDVCEAYSGGKKRCAMNTATSCKARNGPGECGFGFKCNPHAYWISREHQMYLRFDVKRMNAEIDFVTSKLSRMDYYNKLKHQIEKVYKKYGLYDNYEDSVSFHMQYPCIHPGLIVLWYHPSQGRSCICIGYYATVHCASGTFCNPDGHSQSEMCLFDLSDFDTSSGNQVSDHSNVIFVWVGVLNFLAICIIFFILIRRQRKKYRKKMKMEKEKNRMREYKIWERAGKLLDDDQKNKNKRFSKKSRKHQRLQKTVLRDIPEFKFIQESSTNGTLKSYTWTFRSDISYESYDLDKLNCQQIEDSLSDYHDEILNNSDTNQSSRRCSV